jgi:hypothetical protein
MHQQQHQQQQHQQQRQSSQQRQPPPFQPQFRAANEQHLTIDGFDNSRFRAKNSGPSHSHHDGGGAGGSMASGGGGVMDDAPVRIPFDSRFSSEILFMDPTPFFPSDMPSLYCLVSNNYACVCLFASSSLQEFAVPPPRPSASVPIIAAASASTANARAKPTVLSDEDEDLMNELLAD